MSKRGGLYIVWGERAERYCERSIASLKRWHPDLPHHVVRLPSTTDWCKGLLEKARMMNLSPFDETVFLDADTVVLDSLEFGFEKARQHGLACSICECPWARRYRGMGKVETVEYNTGVLFFTRSSAPLFERWKELAPTFNSTIDFVYSESGKQDTMPFNDQGSFAQAVSEWGQLPFVLPLNWNFRPRFQLTWFGPIKVWHDYEEPPADLVKLNEYYRSPKPLMQFHYRLPSAKT